jgi:hypothetical protein
MFHQNLLLTPVALTIARASQQGQITTSPLEVWVEEDLQPPNQSKIIIIKHHPVALGDG